MGVELRHMQVLHLTERAHYYNHLVLTKHPDKGGDVGEFRVIQRAKDFFEAQAEQERELMAEEKRELDERREAEEDALWEAQFEACRKKRADDAAHKEWLDRNKDDNMEPDSDVEVLTERDLSEKAQTKNAIPSKKDEKSTSAKKTILKKKKRKNKKSKKETEEQDSGNEKDEH